MGVKNVYSICGMCTVRCPISVEVENGEVTFLKGNPNFPAMRGLCARGAAGKALLTDRERPKSPMIRVGNRGEGKWKNVSWDEALDYVAAKLTEIKEKYGAKAISFSDRGGPFRDYHRALLRGIGTPNYVNHDASCARNVQHSCQSVTGLGRKGFNYDYKNTKHIVLQQRNVFESIDVQEVNNVTDALENGAKLTVIDIRANVSATKASRFFMLRPGTDYALNLAVIHELIERKLYDAPYVDKHIKDMGELEEFVRPYTLEWVEKETGIPKADIDAFIRELAAAAPHVIWHPGWMTARYKTSFYVCRSIYIINALLGAYGTEGGLRFVNKPGDVGRNDLKSFMDLYPKPEDPRADEIGSKMKRFEAGPGLAHLLYKAMDTDAPYPVKAYIAYRHDPLMGFPDPDELKRIFNKLDLLVSVTFSWSDTAWFSDVVLPLSTYPERESIIACKNGLKPFFFKRDRAIDPRYDSKADWEIVSGLAKRLGLDKLSFNSIEDIWNFQLEGTGVTIADFEKKGFVSLADEIKGRDRTNLKFKTPSGKIEIISEKLEKEGIPSLMPYESPLPNPENKFRITFGRSAFHTQGHTVNNPALNEIMPENILWINKVKAKDLGISNGESVMVKQNGYEAAIKAFVTDCIHPEAVFMVHGFGHDLPCETRAFGKGVADNKFMKGGLEMWDQAGGAIAYQEHFVSVQKA